MKLFFNQLEVKASSLFIFVNTIDFIFNIYTPFLHYVRYFSDKDKLLPNQFLAYVKRGSEKLVICTILAFISLICLRLLFTQRTITGRFHFYWIKIKFFAMITVILFSLVALILFEIELGLILLDILLVLYVYLNYSLITEIRWQRSERRNSIIAK